MIPVVANAEDTGTTEEPKIAIVSAIIVDTRIRNMEVPLRPWQGYA